MSACASSIPARSPVASLPVDRVTAVQRLLDDLSAAAARDDRPAFDELVAPGADAAAVAPVWFANLRTLGDQLRLRATTSEAVPGSDIRQRYAEKAWLQQITGSWRPPASTRSAESNLWLTVVAHGDRTLLAGDTDAPDTDRSAPRPLWLQTQVRVEQRGSVTVIGAESVPLRPWLKRAETAAAAVRDALTLWRGPKWDRSVTVEIPATGRQFARSVGAADGSYARIGAVAWPRGARAETAAVQIVVNPEVAARLTAEGVAVLLAHEVTHVATRSFASAAPTWLVEGIADHIAYNAHPATRAAALRPLQQAMRRGWRPTELPPDAAFDATAADLDLAYAQAWSLCSLLADQYSDATLLQLYVDTDSGTPLPAVLRTLGTSDGEVLTAWRAELRGLPTGRAGR